MKPQVEMLAKQIREKLQYHDSVRAAAQDVRNLLENFGTPFDERMVGHLEEAIDTVERSLGQVEILRRNSLVKRPDPWYRGPGPGDRHWPALQGFLLNSQKFGADAVRSVDESSSEVVALLANPHQEQFQCRGLVVGYVQSGKTANMTAVIAKAVDAGYNLVVLLGGVTNKLRAQTQRRLDNDLVNRHRHLWQLYTTDEDDGDFTIPANRQFTMPVPGRAQLAVMKKVVSRLRAFRRTIEKTPPNILRSLKVLLIDDECDQASVNSSSGEFDMTRINEKIRRIVRALPAVSYVGYTATPFANVFIDPFPHNRDELDDLYPEDFITALPRPDRYFGAHEVFGVDPVDAEAESAAEAGRDMIRRIPAESLKQLQPARQAEAQSFSPVVTEELEHAILWFLASCAIRHARGHGERHMTMLVHTSPNIAQHTRMAAAIRQWIERHGAQLTKASGPAWERMEQVIREETRRVPLRSGETLTTVRERLPAVLTRLQIAVENGESSERIDYTGEPKTYIVIGGAVLARGLTLEGLVVSFFLRTSKQYDTLLQMGRWFGYRVGYEDLPRLWTTDQLASSFRALARVEEEIREDIAVYQERKLTPLEFAVKVRAIPGMAITAASKMKAALRTSISFEGRHVQTVRFDHQDVATVASNWRAGAALVDALKSQGAEERSAGVLFRGVPLKTVRRFLADYSICSEHMDLKKELLIGYVDGAADRLEEWNVGVVIPATERVSREPLGWLGHVRLSRRAKLAHVDRPYADIKALMSKRDILIDVEDGAAAPNAGWKAIKEARPDRPLLLLYAIDRDSSSSSTARADLNAVGDLLGIGLVFPGEADQAGGYFAVELDAPSVEDLDEVVEEVDPVTPEFEDD